MSAGHVLYIHAEDDEDAVWDKLEHAGANLDLVTLMPATLQDGDPLNILDHLKEMEQVIREHDIRLVIIDGQNSVVGTPRIDTDMQARCNVTNKLHQFAQRLNVCLIGVRNEDKEGRAMGPQSFGDIGRFVVRAVEFKPPIGGERYFELRFVKVSDAAQKTHLPIPYSVRDDGGVRRTILWGISRPTAADLKEALSRSLGEVS
jgi:predicted ATP-dependent serine protease